MVTRRHLIGGVAAASVGGVLLGGPAYADYTTTVDPLRSYGPWEGWGASLSWWANVFGDNDTLADLFYTRDTVSYGGRSYPGLGLNIVRYNLGACTSRTIGTPPVSMVASPNIPRYKQIDGYWLDWASTDPASASWNWRADANQRQMMSKARDRGADVFELFSVSPLWWMCVNHNPSGAADGGNNLQSWNYRQHAIYLATVAKYAQDNWAVDFSSVAAFNEPAAPWWRADGPQEGCHLDPGVQQQVLRYLRTELDSRGLDRTEIAASDESTYAMATTTWNSFPPATRSLVGRVDVHGYEYGNTGGPRGELYRAVHADRRRLWQSEYGEGWNHGLYLAYNLSLDLRYLHPTAWCYWQPVDGLTWGLVEAGYPDPTSVTGTLGAVSNKYFVLAQYTRHIRPGMVIIDSGDQATVAAYDASAGRLVLVTVCGDSPQRITYDLSRFAAIGGSADGMVRRWTTDADPNGTIGRQYVAGTDLRRSAHRFVVDIPAHTVETFEVDGFHSRAAGSPR
ncbi:beta-1,6-galactanase [Plantactinospora sp. S1510]|uniref:Beta-1,6-galactanase n=1 Tax=Plantactinospora alkalitolerans TaxID=2789879 RepID=A0ABS0GTV8_9ACTN|nr:glycoside hydrolase [Plantactinospora alkalitolerans]MBF9129634.1 beta-1,6-galactanase [Plantactinospora alkalitolerans]